MLLITKYLIRLLRSAYRAAARAAPLLLLAVHVAVRLGLARLDALPVDLTRATRGAWQAAHRASASPQPLATRKALRAHALQRCFAWAQAARRKQLATPRRACSCCSAASTSGGLR
jgi:hypothetical protein